MIEREKNGLYRNELSLKKIVDLFKLATKNAPVLKVGWIIIGVGCILAIFGFLKIDYRYKFPWKNCLIVLGLMFLCAILSVLTQLKLKASRLFCYVALYLLLAFLTALFTGFVIYVFSGKPTWYNQFFPNVIDSPSIKRQDSMPDSTGQATITKNNSTPNDAVTKSKLQEKTLAEVTFSIQLKDETEGFTKVYVDGIQAAILPESTPLNPRIKIKANSKFELKIITKRGDTCVDVLNMSGGKLFYRFIPNCN